MAVWCTRLLCGLLLLQQAAFGKFRRPELIPAERLIENTKAFLVENPKDAKAYYTLARIHYLTFCNQAAMVHSYGKPRPKELPSITPDYHIHGEVEDGLVMAEAKKRAGEGAKYEQIQEELLNLKKENWKPDRLSPEEALQHAAESLSFFDLAIEQDPKNALYHLGKASLLEQMSSFEKEKDLVEGPKDEAIEKMILGYYDTYKLAIDEDLKREFLPISGLGSMIGYESGVAIARLAEANPEIAKKLSAVPFKEIGTNTRKLKTLPFASITPIVISMSGRVEMAETVNQREVSFDMDGDGIKEQINSWPKKETGILVWDSAGTGEIRSGMQLFGTFGFKMIWHNGYDQLDALDDSRDGWLQGAELPRIRIWFDENENAISEPGEVRSLSEMGITEIAVAPNGTNEAGELVNRNGVRRSNGTTAASVDWLFDVVK